jgi:transposase
MAPSSERTEWRRVGEKRERVEEPEDHALGRSRGGFGTKLHLVVDSDGTPLGVVLSPGKTHEMKMVDELLDPYSTVVIWNLCDPEALAGDKAYSANRLRNQLREMGILPVIPTKSNESPDPGFDRELYRRRNVVERLIGWLKEQRRLATRFEKLAVSFLAMVLLGFIKRYFRLLES